MTSGARNTRDFLNLLRVVGRMWGSHGDKITAKSQGRDVDAEKADKLRRAGGGLGDISSRDSDGAASPWGEVMTSPSPTPMILRQRSMELPSVTSPAPNPLSPGTIMRQVSRDLASPSPVLGGLILRQVSREFVVGTGGGGALSKQSSIGMGNGNDRGGGPPSSSSSGFPSSSSGYPSSSSGYLSRDLTSDLSAFTSVPPRGLRQTPTRTDSIPETQDEGPPPQQQERERERRPQVPRPVSSLSTYTPPPPAQRRPMSAPPKTDVPPPPPPAPLSYVPPSSSSLSKRAPIWVPGRLFGVASSLIFARPGGGHQRNRSRKGSKSPKAPVPPASGPRANNPHKATNRTVVSKARVPREAITGA